MLKKLIDSQVWLSHRFDNLLPNKYGICGYGDYIGNLVPKYLDSDITLCDIGGGKRPHLSIERKQALNITVIGIDIDADELSKAPKEAYDEVIVSDISKYRGDSRADIVLCQAVLEHVKDVESAFKAITSILKPGGFAIIYVPSRNAIYARLNLILSQKIKEKILYGIFPETREAQGFPSFYDQCTPSEFHKLASSNGLSVVEERYYYYSPYFSFFFPAYFVWRLWILLFHLFHGDNAAETFSLVLQKENAVQVV